MTKAKVDIEIQQTDKGNIRIKFNDGGSYLVQDVPANWGLISAFEVELKYAIKNQTTQP
jgi:hypothetical protein